MKAWWPSSRAILVTATPLSPSILNNFRFFFSIFPFPKAPARAQAQGDRCRRGARRQVILDIDYRPNLWERRTGAGQIPPTPPLGPTVQTNCP